MPTSAPPKNRFERRRAETRQALVRAARQILAETGDTSASIQAIAERADVGFGSFYNHFESKTELFDAAVTDALDEFGQVIDERVQGITDPAELVAAGFRLTAQMADSHPELMRILRDRGLAQIHTDRGLALEPYATWRPASPRAASPAPTRPPPCPPSAGPCCPSWRCGWPAPTSMATRPPRTWPRWSCACSASRRTTPTK